MKNLTLLQEALLELGLEDWIPLPEVFGDPEVRPLLRENLEVHAVSRALVGLLTLGRIQLWMGKWSEQPRPVPPDAAEALLLDERRYSFDAEDEGLERVYFVNVENFRASD